MMLSDLPAQVIWKAQSGSQALFLACPFFEALYAGTRGVGKTDALIIDFVQHVNRGWGEYWTGIIFRKSYKQLQEVERKTRRLFHPAFPGAVFNSSDFCWKFPGGERLYLRYMERPADYWNYHGHEYPWIGIEELTSWPTGECYQLMKSCCRSPQEGIPRKYRSTCNPWGPGHNWVKAYFPDTAPPGVPFRDKEDGEYRVWIHGELSENQVLMTADPGYRNRLRDMATSPEQLKAWLYGDWDIVAGGMFDDVWNRSIHVVQPFVIPSTWKVNRSFDWGFSRPFSVGWWAESDGTPPPAGRQYPRGTLFRIHEWYGWSGAVNEGIRMNADDIARGILQRDEQLQKTILHHHPQIKPGPADPSIFDASTGPSIAIQMKNAGVAWTPGNNASRVQRWQVFRIRLKNSLKTPMEDPGLFIFDTCTDGFIRTIPVLQRDEKKIDDINSDEEDHVADETGYRIMDIPKTTQFRRFMNV